VKEVQRDREIPEMERVLHRAFLGQPVLEVGQGPEVRAQAFDGEMLLERCPAQLLGMLDLTGGHQRIDVDALPLCVGIMPAGAIEAVIVQVTARGALLRHGGLESGDGLVRAPCCQQPPTDLGGQTRADPVLAGHEGDVGILVSFTIREVLQSASHGGGAAIKMAARFGTAAFNRALSAVMLGMPRAGKIAGISPSNSP
jgi:hypothetical protein